MENLILKDKPIYYPRANVWKQAVYTNNMHFCQYIAGRTEEECLENAKLFAAAPEMLEALEDAKKQIGYLRNKLTVRMYEFTTPTTTECIELIDKAIRKATE